MRSLNRWLDQLSYKHPRFGVPNLMAIVALGNVAVYILDQLSRGTLSSILFFYPAAILHGQVWRLVTFVFVPSSGNAMLFLLSLYFYWWVGSALEREWGTVKFTAYYVRGMVFNILCGVLLYLLPTGSAGVVSMDYVNLSLFFAFATLYPDMQVLLFFFIPVKVKWLAWLDGALFVFSCLASLIQLDLLGALLPVAAILNYLLFFWSEIVDFLRSKRQRSQYRRSRQTVQFKEAQRRTQQRGYLHKCAVCGKTDTDFPDEEFRYCSQCNGYYCYCSQHIHTHVHVK